MTEKNCSVATLGGGCFWCLEAVFGKIAGVLAVEPGYCGGITNSPTYREVCEGASGHAEVVRVSFDPEWIGFETLLEIFFTVHDPTTVNRQGHDLGTQYRSVILYHSPEQKVIAEKLIARINAENWWGAAVVTQLVPAAAFYPAEEYHRRYFERNPDQGYCQAVIAPKVAKLRQHFGKLIRAGEGN